MKQVGFIGAYDKIDLMIYIAKILAVLGKKVLVIDASYNQKARYVVPVIKPTKMYVTEFEQIDVAVGFLNMQDIKVYLGIHENEEIPYDIVLVNTDIAQCIKNFQLEEAYKNFFVTSFDIYSLKRGLETLAKLEKPIELTKILFSRDMLKEEDDYLNYLSLERKIIWKEDRVYFPIENGDLSVIYENQRVSKIKFKKLSAQYKDGLEYIVEQILDNTNAMTVRRAIKAIEKGV